MYNFILSNGMEKQIMEENVNQAADPEDDESINTVILTDEDGVDTEFEFLDVIETDGKTYVVLLPTETADDGEVVIFRVEGEGDYETYVGVETVEEAEKVFELFKEKAKDDFDFVD